MGGCCNSKTLSYISASLQLASNVIVLLCVVLMAAATTKSQLEEIFGSLQLATTVIVLLCAGFLLNFSLLVILIVGIKQNRITLVKIYVYPIVVFTALYALGTIVLFIMDFVNQLPVGKVFSNFLGALLELGFNILWISPIIIHFKKMRSNRHMPEPSVFHSAQPILKQKQYGS